MQEILHSLQLPLLLHFVIQLINLKILSIPDLLILQCVPVLVNLKTNLIIVLIPLIVLEEAQLYPEIKLIVFYNIVYLGTQIKFYSMIGI